MDVRGHLGNSKSEMSELKADRADGSRQTKGVNTEEEGYFMLGMKYDI